MTNEEILKILQDIFMVELENNSIVLTYDSTAMDIEEWDSLAHIQLMAAIEKHFKIRFKTEELLNFKNVGEIVELLAKKL